MQKFFNTNWADETAVVWGDDDLAQPAEDVPWVRFNINHADGFQASMGAPGQNMYRQTGIITVQIFQPEGQYGTIGRDYANQIIDFYHGAQADGVSYSGAQIREVGRDGFGWYQTNVVVTFEYDTIT